MNALRGVEAKSVEVKFLDPIFAVGDEEFADGSGIFPVEIDRVTPLVPAFALQVIIRKNAEIISVRPEVVVNDIENHAQA